MARKHVTDGHKNEGLSGLTLLWNETVFSSERPFRIFSQCEYLPLSRPLVWVDFWYSGLITRALAPFWRHERSVMPPSFLFFPTGSPFERGFAVLPYRNDLGGDWAERLYEILVGLGVSPAVLDSESLSSPLKPFIPDVSTRLLDTRQVRLYVSDPESYPGTLDCLGIGA